MQSVDGDCTTNATYGVPKFVGGIGRNKPVASEAIVRILLAVTYSLVHNGRSVSSNPGKDWQ